ncbi:uncharacterized protein MONOS_8525 [Monocercomonoides exilis]|uniref:uncharacterized protein n=1 Tax=Monocercomonoides exilis TaxID=2049356 RepID=UPI0035593EC6|nr:hypothetical protein MONOS_8525 [Monocercomonoides exilis]|eukprot:MONOS_8525.1-p1 / transcript=MONOS_8525.1 / gene=MONOS_8525 / organism=Monocercomonoides_exilis_PA203 / gene_product=unspecified product / transcript_product=unspecified product / location=Mono_scaffold00324:13046-13667(+) / protein_length=185 / sequence_SO=supercontig / SO=protein_coding / is_pseudo=false
MITKTKKFTKLFDELERCRDGEQMQKIEEMNGLIDEMNKEELKSIFTIELFNTIYRMIKERRISMENVLVLLKHVEYYKAMKKIYFYSFDESLLGKRMREMIIDENKKKKDENLLTDLCECFAWLNDDDDISDELRSIIVPCLLKAASKKDENEETQKEEEVALQALDNIVMLEVRFIFSYIFE